jgi:hypothetical protein
VIISEHYNETLTGLSCMTCEDCYIHTTGACGTPVNDITANVRNDVLYICICVRVRARAYI